MRVVQLTPDEPELDEHGHQPLPEPTIPGVILIRVTHPDDPVETISVADAKLHPRKVRWRCGRGCPAKGVVRGETAAYAAILEHEKVCPRDEKVAAARAAAREAVGPRRDRRA